MVTMRSKTGSSVSPHWTVSRLPAPLHLLEASRRKAIPQAQAWQPIVSWRELASGKPYSGTPRYIPDAANLPNGQALLVFPGTGKPSSRWRETEGLPQTSVMDSARQPNVTPSAVSHHLPVLPWVIRQDVFAIRGSWAFAVAVLQQLLITNGRSVRRRIRHGVFLIQLTRRSSESPIAPRPSSLSPGSANGRHRTPWSCDPARNLLRCDCSRGAIVNVMQPSVVVKLRLTEVLSPPGELSAC